MADLDINYESIGFRPVPLTDLEFRRFQKMIYELAGISMSDAKKSLVAGRLLKRLRYYNYGSYSEYLALVTQPDEKAELQIMVNLLTTNETHFFREPAHFDFLAGTILPERDNRDTFRVWSAASSTGEEAYTIAMVLDQNIGEKGWEIMGSDINEDVIARAAAGLYSMDRAHEIPKKLLSEYCLKGVRSQEGKFLIQSFLRNNVSFRKINLIERLPSVGLFNVVFLRNVLIYFDNPTKQKIIDSLFPVIKKNGYLLIGHSESLNSLQHGFKQIKPTIYKKL